MSKSLLFIGMLFLVASIIISSLILLKSIDGSKQLNGNLNGSFTMNDSNNNNSAKDILMAYDAGAMLGYDQDDLIQDIQNGRLEGIPFTQIRGQYIFSKKALEEWVYRKTVSK